MCACVCMCVSSELPTYGMRTQCCAEVLRDKVIGQTGRPGLPAAQPLWLVMVINVGKCFPEWCVTAYGLPLSTVQ